MERSQHHDILLVGVALLAAAAACAAAESCDTMNLADQLDSFCRPGEENRDTACCEAVRSVVEMSLTVDPLCICHLEEEPAFITGALTIRGVVRIYIACGGRNSTDVHRVVDRCSAPPPQQQDGPIDARAIYADQPTPQ
ncbi:unnamed protein product [Alopecurus aequalis]